MRVGPQNSSGRFSASLGLALAIFFALAALLTGSSLEAAEAPRASTSAADSALETKLAQYYPRRYYRRNYRRPRYRRPRYRRNYPRRSRAPRSKPAPVVWKVDESNKDPVQLIVSLPKQRIKVFKGTELVATSRVSSGKPGYSTPSGVFSILQKKPRHYSNLYGGAAMPNMQRLTWSGVALHASGSVPGYPASHGCVRLPPSFARQLFGFTDMGQHVIIANEEDVAPQKFSHAKLFQPLPRPAVAVRDDNTDDTANDRPHANPAADETDKADATLPEDAPVKTANAAESTDAVQTDDSGSSVLVSEAAAEAAEGDASSKVAGAGVEQPPETKKEASPVASNAPIRILVTRRAGRERLQDMQQMLTNLGHAPGDVDGFIGRDTVAAIKRFQKSQGLPENGMVTDELVVQIYEVAGREQPTGHIYVRQDFKEIFSLPVKIRDFEKPLGTHFFTVMHHEDGAENTSWTVVSLKDRVRKRRRSRRSRKQTVDLPPANPSIASEALDRIKIPDELRTRISQLLRPGSSFVISDKGLGPETGKGTDFIALTMR